MGRFKWTSVHSVYLPEIDAEHRALFNLVEELQKELGRAAELSTLRPSLVELTASFDAHFKHEERIMKAARYSAYGWHKKQHDAVRWRVRRLVKRIDAGQPVAADELLQFLTEWLQTHTQVSDRMMGAYLRNVLRFNTSVAS
jgi:hemerythrin-like metal-binding protein